jgi:hypothetical protein
MAQFALSIGIEKTRTSSGFSQGRASSARAFLANRACDLAEPATRVSARGPDLES